MVKAAGRYKYVLAISKSKKIFSFFFKLLILFSNLCIYMFIINCFIFREVQRTAGVSTTDLVGRMLLMTRQHFRRGDLEYKVEHDVSSTMGQDSNARSPWTGNIKKLNVFKHRPLYVYTS